MLSNLIAPAVPSVAVTTAMRGPAGAGGAPRPPAGRGRAPRVRAFAVNLKAVGVVFDDAHPIATAGKFREEVFDQRRLPGLLRAHHGEDRGAPLGRLARLRV